MSEVSGKGTLDIRVYGQAQVRLPTVTHQGTGQETETGHRATETTITVRV